MLGDSTTASGVTGGRVLGLLGVFSMMATYRNAQSSRGDGGDLRRTQRSRPRRTEAIVVSAGYYLDTDVIVSWLPLFHDMGMTGFLTVPMYVGAE
jgi:fatty-acyl-CoA synthase